MSSTLLHQPKAIIIASRNNLGVIFHPGREAEQVELTSGPRGGDVGIGLSPAEALGYRWADHFTRAGADWFFDVLRALVTGEEIDLEALRAEAERRNRGGR